MKMLGYNHGLMGFVEFIFLSCLCIQGLRAQAVPSAADDDSELWSSIQVAVPIRDQADLLVSGSFRVGRDFSHPVYQNVGAALPFRLGKHVITWPAYQFVATQYYPGVHSTENRLAGGATISFPLKRIVMSHTQVIEQRFRRPQNSSRYRNRVQIEWPFKFRNGEYHLFGADEVFYDTRVHAWNRNRLYLGASHRFGPHWSVDLFFMKQNSKLSLPRDMNAVGITLRLKVNRSLFHMP